MSFGPGIRPRALFWVWYTLEVAALASPYIPPIAPAGLSDLAGSWATLPLTIDISPLVLVVLTSLVGIFIAAVTVVLVYHWRRFPFEHDIFHRAEYIYVAGLAVFLGLSVLGVLFA